MVSSLESPCSPFPNKLGMMLLHRDGQVPKNGRVANLQPGCNSRSFFSNLHRQWRELDEGTVRRVKNYFTTSLQKTVTTWHMETQIQNEVGEKGHEDVRNHCWGLLRTHKSPHTSCFPISRAFSSTNMHAYFVASSKFSPPCLICRRTSIGL
jgi:hypothetical protein